MPAVMADGSSGAIELALDAPVERTTWLALRALGSKVGEVRPSGLELLPSALEYPPVHPDREPESFVLPGSREAPVSAAHTAAVWVTVAGTPPLGAQEPALRAAAAWATRLADLEHWLSPEIMAGLGEFPGRGDGVPLEILEAHRAELLAAVVAARARWSQR